MLSFERTTNLGLVETILTDASVWPFIGDDYTPERGVFRVNEDSRIWYVTVFDEGKLLGLFSLIPESHVCFEAHVAMLPNGRGKPAHQAGQQIVPWIWQHTECRRLIARVPRCNPAAVIFGLHSMGLVKYGVNPASFLKHGKLWDQVLMGISRN